MVFHHHIADSLPNYVFIGIHGLGQQIHQGGPGVLHEHIDASLFQGVKADGGPGQTEALIHRVIGVGLDQLGIELTQNIDLSKVGGAYHDGLVAASGTGGGRRNRPASAAGRAAGGKGEGQRSRCESAGDFFQVFHNKILLIFCQSFRPSYGS